MDRVKLDLKPELCTVLLNLDPDLNPILKKLDPKRTVTKILNLLCYPRQETWGSSFRQHPRGRVLGGQAGRAYIFCIQAPPRASLRDARVGCV